MLVPPKPWVGPEMGGYFYNRCMYIILHIWFHTDASFVTASAMRYKDSVEQQSYMKRASEQGNVELVYAGLDVLGSTPWKINKKIFDVVLEVWNAGYGLGKLPPAVYPHPEPQPPADNNMKDRALYMYNLKLYNQEKANNHSSRCNVNYKIEIARAVSEAFASRCIECSNDCSCWVTRSINPITWISVAVHTLFLLI